MDEVLRNADPRPSSLWNRFAQKRSCAFLFCCFLVFCTLEGQVLERGTAGDPLRCTAMQGQGQESRKSAVCVPGMLCCSYQGRKQAPGGGGRDAFEWSAPHAGSIPVWLPRLPMHPCKMQEELIAIHVQHTGIVETEQSLANVVVLSDAVVTQRLES